MILNVSGYYYWTQPIWIGSPPNTERAVLPRKELTKETYRRSLESGIQVSALLEGSFLFDFTDWEPGAIREEDPRLQELVSKVRLQTRAILNRVTVMNAHVACLQTSLKQHQDHVLRSLLVTPSDLWTLSSLDVGNAARQEFGVHFRRKEEREYDRSHLAIVEDTLDASFDLLDDILGSEPRVLVMVDLFAHAISYYGTGDFNLCLATIWPLIEQLMQDKWKAYIANNAERTISGATETFFNRRRKDTLKDPRSFTMSVISEVLSLTDELHFSLYQDISKTRRARNKWLHGMEPVSDADAGRSLRVAQELLSRVQGISLHASSGTEFPRLFFAE